MMDRKMLGKKYWVELILLFLYLKAGYIYNAFGPPEPENGEVFNGRGPRYRKQSCHAGYTIACDNGLFKRIVVESGLRPTKNVFIICVEDPDGPISLPDGNLRLLNNTDGITNVTGLIWFRTNDWSPSIVCLPDTVSTSVSTELTSQNITSSVNSSNGISNDSQGHKDKHAVSEDDDTSDGIFGNTAMVAGIASAAGVLVLAPLLVFVLKSLCKATKVDPRPNGLFGNLENGYVMNENKTTHRTIHV